MRYLEAALVLWRGIGSLMRSVAQSHLASLKYVFSYWVCYYKEVPFRDLFEGRC
jgi:hypothetical protein